MILYFSGTGNSAYVARTIAGETGDSTFPLFDALRSADHSPLDSAKPWVVVAPTYAWRIPRLVSDWLLKTPLTGSKELYFVLTCGESIGNAGRYLNRLCATKGMRYMGCAPVKMPENYIALFSTPTRQEAEKTIRAAQPAIAAICTAIRGNTALPEQNITVRDRLSSGIINGLFYPVFVHAKKFYATDACVSCGRCASLCPANNIQMERGKPVWGNRCTHCMACICRCPAEAIEYGRHSQGLPRYCFPADLDG